MDLCLAHAFFGSRRDFHRNTSRPYTLHDMVTASRAGAVAAAAAAHDYNNINGKIKKKKTVTRRTAAAHVRRGVVTKEYTS